MKIYTTYFSKIRLLPGDVVPISISMKSPDWYKGLEYKKLAPKFNFFMEWKRNKNNGYYIDHYYSEVLNKLNPEKVIEDLINLIPSDHEINGIALVCYEKPGIFCHRHIVAHWLIKNIGIKVLEFSDK